MAGSMSGPSKASRSLGSMTGWAVMLKGSPSLSSTSGSSSQQGPMGTISPDAASLTSDACSEKSSPGTPHWGSCKHILPSLSVVCLPTLEGELFEGRMSARFLQPQPPGRCLAYSRRRLCVGSVYRDEGWGRAQFLSLPLPHQSPGHTVPKSYRK